MTDQDKVPVTDEVPETVGEKAVEVETEEVPESPETIAEEQEDSEAAVENTEVEEEVVEPPVEDAAEESPSDEDTVKEEKEASAEASEEIVEKSDDETVAEKMDELSHTTVSQKEMGDVFGGVKLADYLIVGIFSLILGFLMAWGGSMIPSNSSGSATGSGAAAATVNGTDIPESKVTEMVVELRQQQGVMDDAAWAQWLVDAGYTPETLRAEAIESLVSQELLEQAAKEYEINITDAEIDETLNEYAEQFGGVEEFTKLLEESGGNMTDYKKNIRFSLIQERLMDAVADPVEVTDAEVLEIVKQYYPDEIKEGSDSLDGVDEELVSYIREALKSNAQYESFYTWYENYRQSANVIVYDMPAGLLYIVDLTGIEPTVSDNSMSYGEDGSVVTLDENGNVVDSSANASENANTNETNTAE